MVTKRRLPAIFEELPFSRTTALSAGVTSGRLRARDLRAPFHAVRVDSSLPDDVFWRCRAYTERMSAANAFSHHTAAELYGSLCRSTPVAIAISTWPGRPEGRFP